jgi:hypothetical protein
MSCALIHEAHSQPLFYKSYCVWTQYLIIMTTTLTPAHQTIVAIRSSIQSSLKTELPADVLGTVISPLLSKVNQWSTQIPVMFEGAGSPASVNLVFAIRKDLFIGPLYTNSVLGVALSELPPEFQEFANFIQQLIDAQKADKEKTNTKVSLRFLTFIRFY